MKDKYTVYKGKKYKLTGECKRCGKCCIGRLVYIHETIIDNNIGSGYRKIKLENPEFDINKATCNKLDKETKLCKEHKDKKPICSDYPRLYLELALIPDCGYKWKFVGDTDEFNTILDLVKEDLVYKNIKGGI